MLQRPFSIPSDRLFEAHVLAKDNKEITCS